MFRTKPLPVLVGGLLVLAVAGCRSASGVTSASSVPAATKPPTLSSTNAPSSTPPPSSSAPAPAATESNPPGDIPDNQLFVPYKGASGQYIVSVPEGWARTASSSTATFTDKLNSIRVEQSAAVSAPTTASVTAGQVAALTASTPQFALTKVAPFTRAGSSGIVITFQADSAPDPVTNKVVRDAVEQYLLWHNGQLVTLTLTGAKNADNVDPWAKVTNSFRWLA